METDPGCGQLLGAAFLAVDDAQRVADVGAKVAQMATRPERKTKLPVSRQRSRTRRARSALLTPTASPPPEVVRIRLRLRRRVT